MKDMMDTDNITLFQDNSSFFSPHCFDFSDWDYLDTFKDNNDLDLKGDWLNFWNKII